MQDVTPSFKFILEMEVLEKLPEYSEIEAEISDVTQKESNALNGKNVKTLGWTVGEIGFFFVHFFLYWKIFKLVRFSFFAF